MLTWRVVRGLVRAEERNGNDDDTGPGGAANRPRFDRPWEREEVTRVEALTAASAT